MKRNLRSLYLNSAAALVEANGVCELVWQGDFGKGQYTGSGIWSDPGANPCLIYGPAPAAGVSNQGVPQPQWRVGMTVNGDYGAEFVYAKLALAAITDLLPGQAYQLDKDFNATLMTTANSVLNEQVVILNVWGPQTAIGTYYGWFQRAGRCAVQAVAGSIANGQAETTATAGSLKFTANGGHTAGTKSIAPASSYVASSGITFTGNTTNGSPYITNVVSVSGGSAAPLTDLQVGQVITGANLPANSIIAAIDKQGAGGTWRITIGTNTAGSYATLQNATGTAAGTTFTVTSHVVADMNWASNSAQN